MPIRSARRTTILFALAAGLAAPLAAEELSFPSDPGIEAVAPETPVVASDDGPLVLGSGPMTSDGFVGGVPMTSNGSGMVYNPTLGAHLRARFNTRGPGQQQDTLDLGTMKLMDLDGGVAFIDGQVTMNDDSGVGYNLGVGYRWLTLPMFPWSPDDEKIMGISLWSDGQTIGQENFFSQVGVGFELLGERLDFRANGYAPVGSRTQTRDFAPTGDFTFSGNTVGQLLQGVKDTALTVGEAELAGRLGDLDAWAFAGVYGMNGGAYDTVGGKVGLRGYATPDLLLSIAIANDDEFDTNALFSATWFIGRTRAENAPTGRLHDRFREPVLRNDYIATQQSVAFSAGDALLDTNGEAISIVHVDSSAADGGDGSFEAPLNSLDDILANSAEDDIVLAHGGSDFNSQNAVLQDGQTFFGEGNGIELTLSTNQFGDITLPETAPGAASGAIPTIDGGAGAGVTLADNNTVRNLAFDGGVNAIINDPTNGSLNPVLQDLTISGITGNAIELNTIVRADVDDIDEDGDEDEDIDVLDSVTIADVDFTGVGGADIFIDGNRTEADNADQADGVVVSISDVTSTNNAGAAGEASIMIQNTIDTGSVTITDYDYNGGASGALRFEDTGTSISVTESTFTGGTGPAVEAQATRGAIAVGATNTITDVAGDAVVVNANTGAVSVNADISTATTVDGGGVSITANEATVNMTGDMALNNDSIEITNAKASVNLGSAFDDSDGSGVITATGTNDLFVITDNGLDSDTGDSQAGVTINAKVTNNGTGRSVVIDGGNDQIAFSGDLEDNGQGVEIANLEANATVDFGPTTTLTTTTNDAVTLDGNDADSAVTFQELDIATTSGIGIVSTGGNQGELNVTGVDPDDATLFSSSITTDTGRAILHTTGGSSTGGLNFGDVTTGTVANTAIEVTDFDGTVTIQHGTITSTAADAVAFTNTAFALGGDEDDPMSITGGANAVAAAFNDDISRTVSIANIDANGGDIAFVTTDPAGVTDAGTTTASLASIANGGELSWNSAANSTNTLTVSEASFANGFDFDATADGALDVTMDAADGLLAGGAVSFQTSGANDSSLTVDDLASTGALTFVDNSTGTLDVTLRTSSAVGLVDFDSTSSGASSLTLADFSTTGAYDFDTTGDGGLTVTMSDITDGTSVAFTHAGSGSSTLDMTDAEVTGAFDYDVTGTGDLAVTMNTVTGSGDVTLDVTNTGDGSVTMDTVNTGGQIAANGSGTSTGALNVSATDSGGDTAFTDIVVDQQGDGIVTASFNNVAATGTIDFDSASDTLSSLTVTSGDYTGSITIDETGDGDLTATLTNTDASGGVTFNEAGEGDATLTMSGGTYGGAIDADEAGDGALTTNLTNVTTTTGGVTVNEAGAGNATLTMTGGSYQDDIVFSELAAGVASATLTDVTTTGLLDYDSAGAGNSTLSVDGGSFGGAISADAAAGSTGSFSASVTGGTLFTSGAQVAFNAQNTGTVNYVVSGLDPTFSTGANIDAIDLTIGSNVTTGDVLISSNTTAQTLDGSVVDLNVNGGTINFQLSGNTFGNNSAASTVAVDVNGATVNTTLSGNSLNNSGAGDALTYANASGAVTNLSVSGNGDPGVTYEFVNNSAQADFRVRGADAPAVNTANDATITFTGSFDFNSLLNVPIP